jgi:hypothetical protein
MRSVLPDFVQVDISSLITDSIKGRADIPVPCYHPHNYFATASRRDLQECGGWSQLTGSPPGGFLEQVRCAGPYNPLRVFGFSIREGN